jgi:Mlc titration factor MtfA (ptsG expression regulator)
LDEEEVVRLQNLVQVFISEKRFVGCGGLEIDDEVRITIAVMEGLKWLKAQF